MDNDLTPARTLGLLLLAALVWGALIVNSFYDEDSPIQFRANCPTVHASFAKCSESLVWVR